MTGAFLRVERDGKWKNIEVEFLTDVEREKILKNDDRLIKWLNLVCNKLSELDPLLRGLEDEGILEYKGGG